MPVALALVTAISRLLRSSIARRCVVEATPAARYVRPGKVRLRKFWVAVNACGSPRLGAAREAEGFDLRWDHLFRFVMIGVQSVIHETLIGIAKVGEIVEIVTILIGIFGAALILLEIWSRIKTAEEMQKMRKSFEDQLANFRDVQVAKLESELHVFVEDRLNHAVSDELVARIIRVETSYARNLMKLDLILECFQNECSYHETVDGKASFDFERYNRFRSLLTRLITGDRGNVHAALGCMGAEFAASLGYQTATYLLELIEELGQQGRLQTRDLRHLADGLIHQLDEELGSTAEAG